MDHSTDGYPDTHEGKPLHKSAGESGYKGVSISRGGPSGKGFVARNGSIMLGSFPTRLDAALAFARSKEESRDTQSHQRQESRRQNKRKKGDDRQKMHARPEEALPGDASLHYSTGEAQRYTAANMQIQHDIATRCLELLELGDYRGRVLLDLGCGSCLSSQVLNNGAGFRWIGLDVAREMLLLAKVPAGGALVHCDLAAGLPLRSGCRLDGAISVSALQWLCEPPPNGDASDAVRALRRLFDHLRCSLGPSAPAAF
eukprot:1039535-Prymnesium_polylepis.1